MATPYTHKLSSELQSSQWSFCQLHMRSSYMGFGTGSLQRDFEDISACIAYLTKNGKQRIVLMGHSTGSQNSIHYILNQHCSNSAAPVDGVIVQNKFLSRPRLMSAAPSSRERSRVHQISTRRCKMATICFFGTGDD
jgi:hypothetical protein